MMVWLVNDLWGNSVLPRRRRKVLVSIAARRRFPVAVFCVTYYTSCGGGRPLNTIFTDGNNSFHGYYLRLERCV